MSIIAQYSADGQQWTNMGTAQTNLNGFLDPRIGMYATSTNQPSIPAMFDWFTLDFPGDASDEFDGDALDLCRWTEIVRHDPEGYEVTGGELVMPAAHGDFFGNGPNDNPNIVLQPAPTGEWTATTRLRFTPNENFEQAGLIVYGDDANYAKADLVSAGGNRVLEFLRETDDSPAGFGGSVTLPSGFPDTVEIRVTLRRGDAAGRVPRGRRRMGAVRRAGRAGGRAEPQDRPLRQRRQPERQLARAGGVRLLPAEPRACRTRSRRRRSPNSTRRRPTATTAGTSAR